MSYNIDSSGVGQKASKLRDFLEQQKAPGNLGTSKSPSETSTTNHSNRLRINLNCEHDTEPISNQQLRQPMNNDTEIDTAQENRPTISPLNPYGYTGTVNDYKTIELKAQVLRAFLKPKTKRNKPMSEMEVWDHVDIMEEEELHASYSGNALNSQEDLPNLNSAIDFATELDMVKNENKSLRDQMIYLSREKNELTGQNQNQENEMLTNLNDLETAIRAKDAKIVQLEGEIRKLSEQLRQLKDRPAKTDDISMNQINAKLEKIARQQENQSRQLAAIQKDLKRLNETENKLLASATSTEASSIRKEGFTSLTTTMEKLVAWMQETTDDIRRSNNSTIDLITDENRRLRKANTAPLTTEFVDISNSKIEYETQLQNCVTVLKLLRGTVLKW
ncbi:uncharacterized protein LOC142347806 [Convolutriloba macropyga]|uniref:uncharacterized protein LOC142347806 n=1 Tax=Convolutriloba macropyga TaxID=536237 RepID=UPI003F525B78